MGFKATGSATAASVPTPPVAATPATATKTRFRPAAKAVEPADIAADPAADPTLLEQVIAATPAKPKGIVARSGPTAAKETAIAPIAPTAPAADDDPLGWTHSGDEAAAIAAAAVKQREEAIEERRARGYWPQRFELIPSGTPSKAGIINDRFQADIILLDDVMGPSYWEHVLRNSRTGRYDVIEPCPKEFDNCPICPPAGERESGYVSLLSALNINGYTIKGGARAGQHIPITKELLVPWAADHAFFIELAKEHGGLRGIQLTMTRGQKSDPRIGTPSFVGKFTDEEIEAFIKAQGMWTPKVTQEGEKLEEEDWLMHSFRYAEFLHKPSGADLRARYSGTGQPTGGTPIGARSGGADGQWGGGRYAPGAAGAPVGNGPALDDLDDDVPF